MACVFNKQLLHPRNWLTWFGLGILWLIVQLPYPLLHLSAPALVAFPSLS